MFHFHGILYVFQYATIKMIIFCACKNLLNIKSLKGYQNRCVKKAAKTFWWEETLLIVWGQLSFHSHKTLEAHPTHIWKLQTKTNHF